jgi:hypothetical protein
VLEMTEAAGNRQSNKTGTLNRVGTVSNHRGQPEFKTHCAIADLLRFTAMPGVLWFHPPNGEHRSPRTGARLKRMGVRRGVADFIIIKPPQPPHKDGRPIALEIKAEGAYQSAEQREFERDWTLAGGLYFCAKGYAAAADFLALVEVIRPIREGSRFAPRQLVEAAA